MNFNALNCPQNQPGKISYWREITGINARNYSIIQLPRELIIKNKKILMITHTPKSASFTRSSLSSARKSRKFDFDLDKAIEGF